MIALGSAVIAPAWQRLTYPRAFKAAFALGDDTARCLLGACHDRTARHEAKKFPPHCARAETTWQTSAMAMSAVHGQRPQPVGPRATRFARRSAFVIVDKWTSFRMQLLRLRLRLRPQLPCHPQASGKSWASDHHAPHGAARALTGGCTRKNCAPRAVLRDDAARVFVCMPRERQRRPEIPLIRPSTD